MITLLNFINSVRNNPVADNVPDQLDRQMTLFILRQTIGFIILTFFKYGFLTNTDFLYPSIFLTSVDVLFIQKHVNMTHVNLISNNNMNYSKYFFSNFTLPIQVPVSSVFVTNAKPKTYQLLSFSTQFQAHFMTSSMTSICTEYLSCHNFSKEQLMIS